MPAPDPRIRYLEEVRPGELPAGPQPVNRRHTKVEQAIDQARTDQTMDDLTVTDTLAHTGTLVGFNGAAPVVAGGPFVQNYTTADATLGPYTPDDESAVYTGIATGLGGTPYAALTDLNLLRIAYVNLEASHQDLLQFVNAITNYLQIRGDVT